MAREPIHLTWTCVLPTLGYLLLRLRFVGTHAPAAASLTPFIAYMTLNAACVGVPVALKTIVDSGMLHSFASSRVARRRILVSVACARVVLSLFSAGVLIGCSAIFGVALASTECILLLLGVAVACLVIGAIFAPLALMIRSMPSLAVLLQLIVFTSIAAFAVAMSYGPDLIVRSLLAAVDPMMWCQAIILAFLGHGGPGVYREIAWIACMCSAAVIYVATKSRAAIDLIDA